jgi:hypothetical protein
MGGDDLDSDDEFLNPSVQDTAEDRLRERIEREEVIVAKKRKRDDDEEDDEDDEDDKADETPSKKSSMKVLIEAGRDLEKQPTDVQAAFLTMSLKHYVQMKGESSEGLMNIHPSAFVTSKECSLEARLRSVVTKKKLKGWKPIGSPMVVVVCISARRAVAVLKELSGLKIRCGKFFAKHLSIEAQKEMLRNQSFAIVVGTPNRLKALCEPEQRGGKAPMYLGKTNLVVLDTHANQKGYTVCTLPDTAPDTFDLIKEKVLPEMKARKDLKLAFL